MVHRTHLKYVSLCYKNKRSSCKTAMMILMTRLIRYRQSVIRFSLNKECSRSD
ncbi:hypothetical protein HMPREF9533_01570 [Escherichia coli MS 60-1]|nr:hypothetical protein HMPREF9553_00429 [Escherichia coli MS 200-1]EGB83613.1 hypothetical protein HMPREF9533_01570 [Escherichia coli MS 60-1]ESE39058.1 hypothetical protein HMPREF1622_00091 [Escherichia coli A35218R]